ncbi:nicotinate (nicotinamide) nucleotide adenylyltransferase [Cyclobacterium sp.]|uniref:nicotinate (nicotinamide) nucleotide adenylyltransferase n=1 Tax=Cyclobacterium sp. TaxID=1966343 RepID=UPI0019C84389|nr:nicotinate (nicotinamide) nucleotide adenylyltransferase [Cyclobacterium sp.]MBD3630095.1 nicotinate-nucleotide adenylyltransferase [Cyclobacterium sp.]
MKVGLFFGSFNPIHIGHLIIADSMQDQTDLEEVWFVVSPQNPLKTSKSLLHEFDRLKMVELATADNFNFRVKDVEFHMPRPSYTIDTLTYLSEKHPGNEFHLILGGDNLNHFHKWKNSQEILKQYGMYVYPRPGRNKSIDHEHIRYVEAPLLDISATFIRKTIQRGGSVRYLLHPHVLDYIRDKKFFL